MPIPINKELYQLVKLYADIVYKKSSAYKSAYMQKLYQQYGGTYKDDNKEKKLKRWLNEKWQDIGNGEYPVYRPTKRINKNTPLTINEIDKNNLKRQIVNCLYKSPEHTNLLKEGVQAGISNCLKYLRLGEEVLVFCINSAEDTESFECYRKGVVRSINPLRIALYNFELVREPNVNDMIWLDTFDKEIIVSKEELFRIKLKGFLYQMHTLARSHSKVFDDEFKIGKRKIYCIKHV